MQTRRLRLGDVVDDYCPRERRLSNHVIVAMIDDTIKQTRCSTCDFEHPFKDGKVPARRAKKDGTAALVKQVLEESPDAPPVVAHAPAGPRGVLRNGGSPAPAVESEPRPAVPPPPLAATAAPPAAPLSPVESALHDERANDEQRDEAPEDRGDEGPVHRTLIRATLPKTVGETPTRPIPTFTAHEAANARPGKFRRFRPPGPRGGRPFGVMTSGKPSPFTGHPQRGSGPNSGNHPQRPGNQHGRKNHSRRGNKGR
jgi:hypothetical protein